jgi:hypothetical protein
MPFQSPRKWQNYQRKIARAALTRTVAWFVAVGTALFAVTALSAQNNDVKRVTSIFDSRPCQDGLKYSEGIATVLPRRSTITCFWNYP